MRGLLQAMMFQASRLELFKKKQGPATALHAVFNVFDFQPACGDNDWGHLQISTTSLFLITLAQMTTSGLDIVFTSEEVDFVQNLVFYIERAYRTPDFGIWELGSKDSSGTPELHASSIGMAKAALEAIDGLRLFRVPGPGTVHVDPDAHNRNRVILDSFVPRESHSKEVDAALLAILGFPAFAIEDGEQIEQTRQRILDGLNGTHGYVCWHQSSCLCGAALMMGTSG
jgi:phosphorylase kinase alpha/beta subunit